MGKGVFFITLGFLLLVLSYVLYYFGISRVSYVHSILESGQRLFLDKMRAEKAFLEKQSGILSADAYKHKEKNKTIYSYTDSDGVSHSRSKNRR